MSTLATNIISGCVIGVGVFSAIGVASVYYDAIRHRQIFLNEVMIVCSLASLIIAGVVAALAILGVL